MSDELFIGLLFLVFGSAELLRPAESGHDWRGRLRNLGYGALVMTVGAFLATLVYRALPIEPRVHRDPSVLETLFHGAAYLVVADFFYYWFHRAQHSLPAFWQIHLLHHSDDDLNVTSSFRTYWLENPLQMLLIMIPTYLIVGIDHAALTIFAFGSIFFLMFAHANIRLELGPLTPAFVGPQLHRIHHSNAPEHHDRNFAQYFPIYDILFGTYRRPQPGEFPATGTADLPARAPLVDVLTRPFRVWAGMWRQWP